MAEAKATLAGGCFWCLEAVFLELAGVTAVQSGYSGGRIPHPSYEDVCTGQTGHAEVVQVTYDEERIAYRDLLDVFFTTHDPTQLNRQGNDIGTQYRSAIFYHDDGQKAAAEAAFAEYAELWPRPIVTQLEALAEFYPAEEYHRDYFARNPHNGYCQLIVAPKVAKFRQQHRERLKVRA
ncbi:MAG: peptide-methionine (S)-S-oxide reductase MsrA [Anaerolineaceae bacterium]|nr:peptide-methionine (S)-S-oxide reductase MsrA [Anaerolineaceae bacterium]